MPNFAWLGLAGVLLGATLFAACEPLPVRCREDKQCRSGMKCDPRRGLCLDEGAYFEHTDGSTAWATEGTDGGRDAGGGSDGGDAGAQGDGGADAGTQGDGGADAGMQGDGGSGACDGGCPTGEFCEQGACGPCEADFACGPTCAVCAGSTPKCDVATGVCVGCTSSAQCATTTPCCSASTNTCVIGVTNCLP